MHKFLFGLIVMLLYQSYFASGQSMTSELTGLDEYWSLKATINFPVAVKGKVSFMNSSRLTSGYDFTGKMSKLIISNFGYSLGKSFNVTVGGVYANSFGYKSSVGVQYLGSRGLFRWMVFPNLNISKKSDALMPMSVELDKLLNNKLTFIAKSQAMLNFNLHGHLYSSIRLRIGLSVKKVLVGLASDLRYLGKNFDSMQNYGLFFQYKIF